MSKQRILIADATAKQLRDFGELAMGLEVHGRESAQIMQGKLIEAGYTSDSFVPISTEEPKPQASTHVDHDPSRRVNADTGKVERRILIPASDKPGGEDPVQVGVNGRLILIGRGVPSWVPEEYVEVLRNAVEFVYDEFNGQRAANGVDIGGLSKPREIMSYPFQTT